ncbi:MAG: hypothetical protein L6R37_004773 [Teloschistes peruensis]|nr:MAG: hypothetical protein L6R37_004773 [Teloschistes peruensis]
MTRTSKRLIASYVLDWIIILATAAIGAGFWKITPNHRPFTLTDPSISFPYVEKEKVSTTTLFLVSLVAPAIITFAIAIVFVPGPSVAPGTPRALIWKRKLWEWNTAWMGLGLSLALAFFFTQGMKNLFGKPRPDLLSRCQPDYENQAKYQLGGFPTVLNGVFLVSATICQQKDKGILNDGFSSFPSGHSSYSFAGLLYLSLFLASKFQVTVPYLLPFSYNPNNTSYSAFTSKAFSKNSSPSSVSPMNPPPFTPLRRQSAAPPLYLLPLPLIPLCTAIYICSTRFSDFRHHGFDILFGALMGIVFAVFTFRLYHLPITRGGGWSWGPRSMERAFGAGVGLGGYVMRDTAALQTKRGDEEVGEEWSKRSDRQETSGDSYGNGTAEASSPMHGAAR